MQELSADKDMTLEDKMKKRQEIQQEIANLNQQLRQHQIEQRKEQQSKNASAKENNPNSQKTDAAKQGAGFSSAGMTAILSADSSMKQAKVQCSVATQMEGRADNKAAAEREDNKHTDKTDKDDQKATGEPDELEENADIKTDVSPLENAAKETEVRPPAKKHIDMYL